MLRALALVCLLVPASTMAIECILQTTPLHAAAAKVTKAVTGQSKSYVCPTNDQYCIYFEGNLEVGGKNETFSVHSCESDIKHYLGPIGEKVGRTIGVKCEKIGPVSNRVANLSYKFDCCKDSNNCNETSAASFASVQSILVAITAALLALTSFV